MTRLPTKARSLTVIAALALVVALTLSLGQHAQARGRTASTAKQSTSSAHTMTVSGHGDATATPDRATITVGVQTKGSDAQAAFTSASTKLNAVIAAIEAQGVTADRIQTSDLSMYFDSQSNGYVVSHSVTVTLDSVNKTGPVLDAAVAAGANNSWGVNFGLKDSSAPRSQALTAAIADARQKANVMAAALGVSVTGVQSVSESSSTPPIPYAAAARAPSASSSDTQVQPGQLTISADVNVVYTFG